jgi:probable F420-dependent oxidoreductase
MTPGAPVLDAQLPMDDLRGAADAAQAAEAAGFAGVWANETKHNPFVALALAAAATRRVRLGTGVAIAFPRSPTVVAHLGWDLAALSGGRFVLGLGTQVRGHIERRFGVRWEPPVSRLREYIGAVRAIWRVWQEGGPLRVEGRHYRLSLMTPFFNPGPIPHPEIPVSLAGVNAGLCRLAGEIAQGFNVHPFHTVAYVTSVVRRHIDEGLRRSGRSAGAVALYAPVFVAPGDTPEARREARRTARAQIAFYASTPTYAFVLRTHGWEEVGRRLGRLAAEGRWDDMPAQLPDEVVDAVLIEGGWDEVGHQIRARYAGVLDRVGCYRPFAPAELPQWRRLVDAFHAG